MCDPQAVAYPSPWVIAVIGAGLAIMAVAIVLPTLLRGRRETPANQAGGTGATALATRGAEAAALMERIVGRLEERLDDALRSMATLQARTDELEVENADLKRQLATRDG